MTFWEKSGDEWDPTVPNTAELLEDWNVWFESIGKSQDKALERLFFVIKEVRDKYQQPFRINREEFMVGPPMWSHENNGVFEKIVKMSDPVRGANQQSRYSMYEQGLKIFAEYDFRTYAIVGPAPGFSDDYLPWLDISDIEVFVALYTEHHSFGSSYLHLILFTTELVPEDALICPTCEKDYQRALAQPRSTHPLVRGQDKMLLMEKEKRRFFTDHDTGKNFCNVRPGLLIFSRQMSLDLINKAGYRLTTDNVELARQQINEWCARTPGLYHVPTSHGLRKYTLGDSTYSAKVKGELLNFFTVRNKVGQEPDEDVAQGDITKAMVTRWRKALGLPAVKKTRAKKA